MAKSMRSALKRVLLALAVFIGAISLIGLTVRWFIYDIERYREVISSQISQTLKLNVSIGKLEGGVSLLNPVIYVEQAKFSISDDFDQPMVVEQTEIVLDLLDSVLNIEPRIRSIQMRGVEFTVSTDMENKALYLPQIEREFHLSQQRFDINRLLTNAVTINYYDLSFHDVLMHWDDKNMEDIKTFHIEHFTVNSQYHQTQLSLAAQLPEPLGEDITLTTTLDHDQSNPAGDFYINVANLDLTKLYQLLDMQSINKGILQTELNGRISYQRGLEKLTGTVALKDGQIDGLNLDNAMLDIETDLNWQAQEHNRELSLNGLFVEGENTNIQNAEFTVVQTRSEDAYHSKLQLRSDNISAAVYNEILAYAKTDFSIEQGHTTASVHKQAIDLTLHAGHSSDWFASPHDWPPIQLAADADMPELLSGDFELVLNDVGFEWAQWRTPQGLGHVKLKGNYKRGAAHEEWHLEQIDVKDADSNLSGNLSYKIGDNQDRHIRSSLRLDNFGATEIKQWVPHQTFASELENLLRNALRGGTIEHAELLIDGDPDFPFGANAGTWQLHAKAKDVNLLYSDKEPEFKELDLDLLLKNQSLKVQSDHLKIEGFDVNDMVVELADITTPHATVTVKARGSIADILSYAITHDLVDPNSAIVSNIETDDDVDIDL